MSEIYDFLNSKSLDILEILIFGVIFFFIERIRPAEKDTPFFKDDLKNEAFLASINIFVFIPINAFLAVMLLNMSLRPLLGEQLLAPNIEALPIIIQIVLGAIILDLSTYWRHRFTHRYMWSYHSLHHSADQITWLTSLRLHPIDLLAAALLDTFVLYIFGFSGAGFLGAMILARLMNYFTHINMDIKFPPPIRYLIASPHYHRWHHATVKSAYDKNFCGAFPFWDILFGTYYHPEELPPATGLSAIEQKDFPRLAYLGWLTYPFQREYKIWKKKFSK
ncbi:MAG: sterol desaturase family protein [Alphaproteobacteria bacterium]